MGRKGIKHISKNRIFSRDTLWNGVTVMYGCEKVTGITEAERNSIY
ncbi:MAG: hypothetical protein IIY81_03105 [Lachnospiraceae bacterium]|nr:hypothetical protein [Lachnospiraceae bacterium]